MYDKYTLKENESLRDVANKFKTSIDVLKDINNIYFDSDVRVGMDIIVPKNKQQYFNYYTIEAGDSLYKIAQRYNVSVDDILKSGYSYYITAEGDTLDTVKDMFKVSKEKVLEENPTIYLLKDQVLVTKR